MSGKGKFEEALHPRATDGKFKGTSKSARQSRNKKRKTVGGAAIGTAVLPGIGTAVGAGIGHAVARNQNKHGNTPNYKAYSTKKQNKLAAKSVKKNAAKQTVQKNGVRTTPARRKELDKAFNSTGKGNVDKAVKKKKK